MSSIYSKKQQVTYSSIKMLLVNLEARLNRKYRMNPSCSVPNHLTSESSLYSVGSSTECNGNILARFVQGCLQDQDSIADPLFYLCSGIFQIKDKRAVLNTATHSFNINQMHTNFKQWNFALN